MSSFASAEIERHAGTRADHQDLVDGLIVGGIAEGKRGVRRAAFQARSLYRVQQIGRDVGQDRDGTGVLAAVPGIDRIACGDRDHDDRRDDRDEEEHDAE